MAEALAALGLHKGYVVHGSDGLDEITTTGPTLAFEVHAGKVTRLRLSPEDFGVELAQPGDLKGGDREANREIVLSVLAGEPGPRREIVLVNSSAVMLAAGKARDFREGVSLAAASIDSGAALRKVQELARFTQQFA